MAGTHALGVNVKLLIEPGSSPHVFDENSERYEILSETLAWKRRYVGGNEMSGSRTNSARRVREGAGYYTGSLVKYISPAEIGTLAPKFLGEGTEGVYTPAANVPYFGVLVYRDEGIFTDGPKSTFQYADCKINSVTIRGRAPMLGESGNPDMVTMAISIFGSDRDLVAWPASEPDIGSGATYSPYVFQDCNGAFYLNGVAREVEEFAIQLTNALSVKYTNGLSPHSIVPADRQVRLAARLVWNDDTDDLLGAVFTSDNYVTFTNPGGSTKFEFGDIYVDHVDPYTARGKGQVGLVLNGQSYSTTSKPWDLKITNTLAS